MPATVKDNILKMKDVSELMIEMAYSALFLRDISVANEVEELFKDIQNLENETLKLIFKVRDIDEAERIVLLDLIDYVKDIANAARGIASTVKEPKFPSIIQDILKSSDMRVITETIVKDSILANKTVGDAKIRAAARGARILCIKRDGNWIFDINKDTRLQANDFIVAVGTSHAERVLKDTAAGRTKSLS